MPKVIKKADTLENQIWEINKAVSEVFVKEFKVWAKGHGYFTSPVGIEIGYPSDGGYCCSRTEEKTTRRQQLLKKDPNSPLLKIPPSSDKFGDVWGLLIIFVNLMEGIFLILGFKLMEKLGEGDTKLGWGIAGGLGNFFQAPFFWIINQRWYLHWVLWVLAFMFAFISGILITGLLGRTTKNYLIKAGVPTTF